MERSILGVTRMDRIRNTTLRSKTRIADVGEKTARLKWDWAGHRRRRWSIWRVREGLHKEAKEEATEAPHHRAVPGLCENTTLHGLRYVTEVGLTVVEKVFWILTFVASLVMCFILIERVWHKWWYSPVIVSFNEMMIPVGEVPFPSITICPQWKCKSSAYRYTEKFVKYGKKRKINTNVDKETLFSLSMTNDEEERILLEDAFLVCENFYRYLTPRNKSNESLVNNIINMAPDVEEVMLSCTWRGQQGVPCGEYFKEVLTSEGVCFNFNALSYNDIFRTKSIQNDYIYINSSTPANKWNIISGYSSPTSKRKKKKYSKGRRSKVEDDTEEYPRRGQENGARPDLEIILVENATDVDESCNSLSNGWKIYLQHPADMPQASLYYYAAIPDQVTSLALKFSILNTSESLMNYKSEQRQCYFPKDRKLLYFATYTPDNCRLECLSLYTYKRCGCVWYHMPHHNSSEIGTSQQRRCVEKAQDELASNKLKQSKCNCLPSCDSVHYDAEILKTNFDIKKHMKAMNKKYDYTISDNYNYSRLEIYFKEPRFVSMRRSELFGLTDFLANCGGLLGLFLGFSFLSLVEIFYFCTLRLWCTLKKDIKIEKKKLKESMYRK
ncbi:pickpocket protein 28-like [Leguminivora glycinivorella]|uniref:pickpocket protein 28-like n=1 Tax=Leguminivora glycinivorella TaxID=1035111 RepID=UPI00200EDB5D|nr:pickpocket protein 28-like [Leguminivora glycinivorella]